MQTASNTQVPGNGAQRQTMPFEIHWPDLAIEDSDEILKPQTIVNEFRDMADAFHFHSFLLEHLIDLVHNNFFEEYTHKGMKDFTYKYGCIADIILKLEKHSADRTLKWNIENFMRLVLRKDDAELSEIEAAIEAVTAKYGSLTNGMHHFTEQHRRNLTKAKN